MAEVKLQVMIATACCGCTSHLFPLDLALVWTPLINARSHQPPASLSLFPRRSTSTQLLLSSTALARLWLGSPTHTALPTFVFLCSRSTVAWPFVETGLHLSSIACRTSGSCHSCPNAVFYFSSKVSKYRDFPVLLAWAWPCPFAGMTL